MPVDSYKWLPRSLATFYKQMDVTREEPVPWTPLRKPLSACRVALVTTAGLYAKHLEPPFDVERERRDPFWGDPTFRTILAEIRQAEIGVSHLHIDTTDILTDVNVCFPIDRLREAAAAGRVGSVAPRHYSFMGYQMDQSVWRRETGPAVARALREDGVDCVLLTPV